MVAFEMLKNRFVPIFFAFVAILALPLAQADETKFQRPAQWAQPVGDLYNLHEMTPLLYRSSLPDQAALPVLDKLKIHTIINFLAESDTSWLTTPGVNMVQLPYRTRHVDDADVIVALRAIRTAEAQGPVLIHCKHGTDRTGLIAAMYRVVVQGWTKEEALQEMTQGGFGDTRHFKDGIRYMQQTNIENLRNALASGACSTSPFATCALKNWLKSANVQ
jgi:protein tyrosine/serine phosphatase